MNWIGENLNTIIYGDCYEIIKQIPDNSIDMILTSPPYDNLRTYNGTCNWNFEKFKNIAKELYRILKEGGVVVWIVNDQTIDGSESGTSFKQALYFKEVGFNLHDTMIWEKPAFTATGALKTRYAQVFEYMFVFSKGKPKTFNPIKDRLNKCYGQKIHGTIRQKDGSTRPVSSKGKRINKFGQRFNIWKISPEKSSKNRFHPAQFPVELARDHIISWSNENETVLDPFCGSGTTCVACKEIGRNFIGIEINKEYYKISVDRLNGIDKNVQTSIFTDLDLI